MIKISSPDRISRQGVLPPAVINFIVAEQFGQEPQRVASIVLLGNLASVVVIPITLLFVL